jgi:WXG100 family type VII secretion target
MNKIQARYDEIDSIIIRLLGMLGQVSDQQGKLANQADYLANGGWIGRGSDRFYDEFYNYVLPALRKLEEALRETAIGFRKAHETLSAAEQEGARLFASNDILSPNIVVPSQRDLLLQRIGEVITNRKLSFHDLMGLINNGYGIGTGLVDDLPGRFKYIGYALKLLESGSGDGNVWENLGEGVVQIVTDLGVEAGLNAITLGLGTAVMIGNDVVQLGGKLSSGFSTLIHDINPDPALASAIKHFDITLENADLGSVTGSFSSVVVDLFQMGITGREFRPTDPFTSAISIVSPMLAGAIRRPELIQEFGHNGLTFVGSVIDFGAGLSMLPHAAVDMSANTWRVGTHAVGQFFNLPPELNTKISTNVGDVMQFFGTAMADSLTGGHSPREHIDNFNRHSGLNVPQTLDFSSWLGSLIPKPN